MLFKEKNYLQLGTYLLNFYTFFTAAALLLLNP